MKRTASLLAAVATTVPALAFAQDPPAPGQPAFEKETTLNFEEDVVTGQLVRPDGANVTGSQERRGKSLIKIREDFIPELVDSVEKL